MGYGNAGVAENLIIRSSSKIAVTESLAAMPLLFAPGMNMKRRDGSVAV